jgi:DNA polymerase
VSRALAAAAADAADCTRCRLANGRTQVVFGVGNSHADVMLIGEAPGFHEDKQGEPFVGAAGQLLTRMLREVVGLAREDVYICNVLKCRPPGNRDPQEDEIESCTPWLVEQVSLIQPRVIATLGNFATKFVLQTAQGITRVRGSAYPWHGRTVIPTFHPAAILRGGGETSRQFAEFRADFELMRDTLATLAQAPDDVGPPASFGEAPATAVREVAPPVPSEPVIVPEAEPLPEEQLELF